MREGYDVIVVGAGIAGLSAAYFISQEAKVLVLERESQPAYHASGRSAAMYIEGYENPVVNDLTVAGRDFFHAPPTDLSDTPILHRRGGLTVGTRGEEPKIDAFIDRWGASCLNLRKISAGEAMEIVPILREDWVHTASFDPDWWSMDVHALLTVYRKGLLANRGDIVPDAEVTEMRRDGGTWRVSAADTVYRAPVVVNAAGAWASLVGEIANASPVPLSPLRRTAVLVELPENGTDWPLVHTANDVLYFKPEGGDMMVSPADEHPSAPMDARPEELDVALTMQLLGEITTHPADRLLHQWAGLRTFAPDRRPVVGFDAKCPGFFWLAGQGGFGVQTSAGLGHVVAQAVNQGVSLRPEIDVARFV